jgi:hypothetical protein
VIETRLDYLARSIAISVLDLGAITPENDIGSRFETAGLVHEKRPRPSMAPHPRTVRHLGIGNHAPTDPGENRHSLLETMDA